MLKNSLGWSQVAVTTLTKIMDLVTNLGKANQFLVKHGL